MEGQHLGMDVAGTVGMHQVAALVRIQGEEGKNAAQGALVAAAGLLEMLVRQ